MTFAKFECSKYIFEISYNKNLVYNIKESIYPTDEKFLTNLASISNTFNIDKPNLSNIL